MIHMKRDVLDVESMLLKTKIKRKDESVKRP